METRAIDPAIVRNLSRKVMWRIMPLAGFLGLVAFLDRISLAFAGPQGMNDSLAMTATMFGFAVGIFTVGYVLFEVPTAGLATKAGSRKWITKILITWGLLQCVIAFAPNFETLIVLRFLLGVAEAGFTPTIYFYITAWFTRAYRPLAFVIYGSTIALSSIFGPIISAGLISAGNALPFAEAFPGWRFLLLFLGLLAVASAIPAHFGIVETPKEARWLNDTEKQQYADILAADAKGANIEHQSIMTTIGDWRAWVLGLGFFAINYASYTIQVWTPTVVTGFQEQFGTTFNMFQSALLAGIPMLIAMIYAFGLSWIAGKTGQSGILIAGSAVLGGIGCLWTTVAGDPSVLIIALAMVGMAGMSGNLYMPLVSRVFAGAGAYSAIAIVNSLGAAASFFSPIVTGYLIDTTGNTNAGFYFIAGLLVIGAAIAVMAQRMAAKTQLTDGKFDEAQKLPVTAAAQNIRT
ncbi:MFS transporter [Arthrobacter mobilis]|uniref:MFS transporter n=1 Tax=Arthrobacter mobilis TaxID=2724944 RepID=A0A7X6QM96_9MICC|nr:MFS transporter [Arthrobacter mobilis]NKX56552.1 MFS transporter [Arthrobacter mobilis]